VMDDAEANPSKKSRAERRRWRYDRATDPDGALTAAYYMVRAAVRRANSPDATAAAARRLVELAEELDSGGSK